MGYTVATSGRLLLPESLERQALTVLEVDLAPRDGWYDESHEVDTLAELGSFAGAEVRRDGDWLVLATDEESDPKWSEQATAFYVGLAHWVHQGEVHLEGEDGARWSYRYGADGVIQIGQNGWDGSLVPFGEPVAASPDPLTTGSPAHSPVFLTVVFLAGIVLIIGLALVAAGI